MPSTFPLCCSFECYSTVEDSIEQAEKPLAPGNATMMKAYKYRLYPTHEIQEKLTWTLARCCEVYNAALQERRDTWNNITRDPRYYDPAWKKQATKEHAISRFSQINQLAALKQEIRPEYQKLSSAHLLNDVCARVERAFQAFFRREKSGQKPGYPRFHSNKRYDSFCYPNATGWKIEGNRLTLTRIGSIKMKLHRPIPAGATIKTCTIKREGKHWYASFACEVPSVEPLPTSTTAVGIDVGITHFAALSDGSFIESPRYFRASEKKLAHKQQALKHKHERSKRRKKAGKEIGNLHRRIARQRKDFLQKASRQLINAHQVLVFEDLHIANLNKRPKTKQDQETGQYLPNGASAKSGLNKSIADAGWGYFLHYCTYKAAWAGRTVVVVNPKNTSQVCSQCGKIGPKKDLSERWHSCECGCELDRDTNAALNILTLGQKQLAAWSRPSGGNP